MTTDLTGKTLSTFARNLKKIRLEKGVSVRELSKKSGIQGQLIHAWERAAINDQHVSHVKRIADALGVSVDELLKD